MVTAITGEETHIKAAYFSCLRPAANLTAEATSLPEEYYYYLFMIIIIFYYYCLFVFFSNYY